MEFTSFDGEKIWYKVWEAGSPRAVIQIMTGLAEVADYYEIFAPEMVKAGYTVALHSTGNMAGPRLNTERETFFEIMQKMARPSARSFAGPSPDFPLSCLPTVSVPLSRRSRSMKRWRSGTVLCILVPPTLLSLRREWRNCLPSQTEIFFFMVKTL